MFLRGGVAGVGAVSIAAGVLLGTTHRHPVAVNHGSSGQPMRLAAASPQSQYWMVAADGGIFSFGGAPFYGSTGNIHLAKPIVGMAATPDGGGYWFVASDGGIFTEGDAGFFGSQGATPLNQPVVGMARTPDGLGYWLVARDGGIFTHGDAGYFGSTGGIRLNQPIVGMAATPDGLGYWLVAADGGIFTFGDAGFFGSAGAIHLNQPIVGMAASPSGLGYWLVARDGGIFAYGDAGFFGSAGAIHLNQPIVGMAATQTGNGYWFVASDGGIFAYGDAVFSGSMGGVRLAQPVVGMAGRPVLFPGTISLSSTSPTVTADGVSTVQITATVTDPGVAVPGVTLVFGVLTNGCGTLSNGSGVTNLAGQVTVTYTSSPTVLNCQVGVAEVFGPLATSTAVNQVAGAPAYLNATPTRDGSYTADQGNAGIPATFTLSDSLGHAISGTQVNFSTNLSTCTVVPSSGTTDSNGSVGVAVHDTTVADSCVVSGSVPGTPAAGSTGHFNITPGAVHSLSVSPVSSPQVAGTGYDVTVTAKDAYGNLTNPSESAIVFSGTAVNDSLGGNKATEHWKSAAFTNGQATVTVTSYAANSGAVLTVSAGAGTTPGSTNAFTINPTSVATIGASPQSPPPIDAVTMNSMGLQITFTVSDTYGNPVPNVALTVGGGTNFTHASSGVPGTLTTADGTGSTPIGRATFTLKDTDVADSGKISGAVTAAPSITSSTGTITITPGTFNSLLFSDTSTTAWGVTTSSVGQKTAGATVNVYVFAIDAYGNTTAPTATTTIGGTSLTAAPDGTTGTTSPGSIPTTSFTNGMASLSFTPTDAQQGATLTATSGSVNGSATFNVVGGPYAKLVPVSTSFIASDLSSTSSLFFQSPPGTGASAVVTLQATDQHLNQTTNGIAGHSVKVTLSPDNVSVLESPDSGTIQVGGNPAGVSDAAGAPVSQIDSVQSNGTVAVKYTTPVSPAPIPVAGVGQITCVDATSSSPACTQPIWVTVTTLTSVVMTPPGTSFDADTSSTTGISLVVTAKAGSTAEPNIPIDYSANGFTGNPQPQSPVMTASTGTLQATSVFKPSLVTAAGGTVTATLRGAPQTSTTLRSTPPSIAIIPGKLFSLTVGNLSPASPTAGTPYTATVTAADKEGNPFNPGVQATATGPLTSDSINGNVDQVVVGAFASTGIAPISATAYKAETATFTISATASGTTVSSPAFSVTVQAAAPYTAALSLSVTNNCCTADQGNSGVTIAVQVNDRFGNGVPNTTVNLSTNLKAATVDPGTGTYQNFPAGITTASTGTIGKATATFKDYQLPNMGTSPDQGNITATVPPGGGNLAPSVAVNIVAGQIHSIIVDPVTAQTVATAYTVRARAFDTYGNLEESYTPSSTFTQTGSALSNSPAPSSKNAVANWGPLDPTTFKAPLTITSYDAQQNASLTVSLQGTPSVASSPVTYAIAPAAANQIVLASVNGTAYTSSSNATEPNSNGATYTFVLKVEDQYNNPVTATHQTDTVNLTLTPGTPADGGFLQANTATNPDTTSPQSTTCTLSAGSCTFIYQAPAVVVTGSTGYITWTDSPLNVSPAEIIMSG